MKKLILFGLMFVTSFSGMGMIHSSQENYFAQDENLVFAEEAVSIQKVRQAMELWQETVQSYSLDNPQYTIASLQQMGPANFDASYHWIVPKLYNDYYENLIEYHSVEEDADHIGNLREILSHSFGLEKMLLAELSQGDQEALNQLRLFIVSAIMESYQAGINQNLPGYFLLEGTDFAKNIEKYLALDDQHLDQLIRISLASSYAPEVYRFGFGEDMFTIPEALEYPSEQYEIYTITNGVFVQDIGGTTPYYFHIPSGKITEGHLASLELHPLIDFDWSEVYGRVINNYYPNYQAQSLSTEPKEQSLSWSSKQKQALMTAVKDWQAKMGQKYEFVTPETPLNFLGGDLPLQSMVIHLDGQERKAYYQAEKLNNDEIDVLMAMTDIRDQDNPRAERHFYLFVEDQGVPRVLITMEGPDNSAVHHFKDTANVELYQLFKSIY
ncbi:DUF4767 domain-containing protein [Facklamia sp. 7083-14-GEN3]|uniref:DUF4767 domain-containing protein n=1 Tax=Facklamia sp. 7083-14-GEN3 TaxID=2973478 RepID=UPI00215C11FB|nr:DUF4767 domain-containing protein [Facklamia sp. 7083-14-GEN3]MCR8969891.1 DUF4767 domain-containing protein [Facklamia sp. 7083-14-GEN3]